MNDLAIAQKVSKNDQLIYDLYDPDGNVIIVLNEKSA